MTILDQILTSDGEPSDDLMSARHKEMDALRPKPNCCTRSARFVYLSHDGKWYLRGHRLEFFSDEDSGEIQFCPCCGTKLPAVRRKEVQSETLCIVTSGDYCDRCRNRLPCWCDPLESAWEVVP